jgi:hydroxymethylpyrimidine pyrophosphatase-like HAD family hydrolase
VNYKIVAVDFDGTLFENKWPEIGEPHIALIDYLKKRQEQGDKLILWTCRCGDKLDAAVKKCETYGLIFDAVNENLPEAIEMFGGDSRKIFAHEYIDDKNFWPHEYIYIDDCNYWPL